jgi:hypothetical protein
MMKRNLFVLCLLLFAGVNASAISLITNGSFEDDGLISNIKTTPPYGWDVNIPSNFGGETTGNWKTRGSYSLWLYSSRNYTFAVGDNAEVSQQVDLTDANEIIFDLYLSGYKYAPVPWDSNKVTAFMSIDSNAVWQSDTNDTGVYYDVNIPLDGNLTGIHTLSFGIYSNVSEKLTTSYWARWDFVKFDTFCGGLGYLEADFNRDCLVNFADFSILAEKWMQEGLLPQDEMLDLEYDGKINLLDLKVFADQWLGCTDWQDANCIEIPLDLDADINLDGIVNFLDYSILVSNWGSPIDLKADIDGSGKVDYKDLAIMSSQWLQKTWLYEY